MPGLRGAWRSLVAHLLWEQGVGGSNPLAPTAKACGTTRTSAKPPRGCSSTVEPQPSKLVMGVRFPSPALAPRVLAALAAEEQDVDYERPGEGQAPGHDYHVGEGRGDELPALDAPSAAEELGRPHDESEAPEDG
jgi:hypothetical protein